VLAPLKFLGHLHLLTAYLLKRPVHSHLAPFAHNLGVSIILGALLLSVDPLLLIAFRARIHVVRSVEELGRRREPLLQCFLHFHPNLLGNRHHWDISAEDGILEGKELVLTVDSLEVPDLLRQDTIKAQLLSTITGFLPDESDQVYLLGSERHDLPYFAVAPHFDAFQRPKSLLLVDALEEAFQVQEEVKPDSFLEGVGWDFCLKLIHLYILHIG